jgi:hypothetical protein
MNAKEGSQHHLDPQTGQNTSQLHKREIEEEA